MSKFVSLELAHLFSDSCAKYVLQFISDKRLKNSQTMATKAYFVLWLFRFLGVVNICTSVIQKLQTIIFIEEATSVWFSCRSSMRHPCSPILPLFIAMQGNQVLQYYNSVFRRFFKPFCVVFQGQSRTLQKLVLESPARQCVLDCCCLKKVS